MLSILLHYNGFYLKGVFKVIFFYCSYRLDFCSNSLFLLGDALLLTRKIRQLFSELPNFLANKLCITQYSRHSLLNISANRPQITMETKTCISENRYFSYIFQILYISPSKHGLFNKHLHSVYFLFTSKRLQINV